MDFSENFTTVYQEEIQSLHWSKTQVSIHSMVVTRPTVPTDSVDNCNHVKEHWLVISDELSHDYNFVHRCLEQILVPELEKLGCEVSVLHQRTDGCAAQYKSLHCFGDVSRSEIDLKMPVIRSFSGSGHGKGEVDSAAGYLKTAARKAVVVRDIGISIHNAKDLYDFASVYLKSQPVGNAVSLHARRFFYVSRFDIKTARNRAKFRNIKGTQKLHSVASVNAEGQLKTRMLSCYCVMCIERKYDECENKSYVNPFSLVHFSEKPDDTSDSGSERADSDYEENQEENQFESSSDDVSFGPPQNPLFEMICKDSVVAVRPHSQSLEDYFLFNVTSDGMVCLPDTVESCGHTYSQGTYIVEGYYFEHLKSNRKGCIYRKSANSTKIIIPVECVLYVGIDLVQDGGQYILQVQDHEDIMCFI